MKTSSDEEMSQTNDEESDEYTNEASSDKEMSGMSDDEEMSNMSDDEEMSNMPYDEEMSNMSDDEEMSNMSDDEEMSNMPDDEERSEESDDGETRIKRKEFLKTDDVTFNVIRQMHFRDDDPCLINLSFFACFIVADSGIVTRLRSRAQTMMKKYAKFLNNNNTEIWNNRAFLKQFDADNDCCTQMYNSTPQEGLKNHACLTSSKRQLLLTFKGRGFSLVTNANKFFHHYFCDDCAASFGQLKQYEQHECGKGEATIHSYPGGVFRPKTLLFEGLQKLGVDVTRDEYIRYLAPRFFVCYDTESALLPRNVDGGRDDGYTPTESVSKHQCCVVSMCDSETLSSQCLIADSDDDETWMEKFVDALESIRMEYYEKRTTIAKPILKRLMDGLTVAKDTKNPYLIKKAKKALYMTKRHLGILPILGWNSSRYDLTVLRQCGFYKILRRKYKRVSPFLRKGKTMRLECGNGSGALHFLDYMLFQANSQSLASFLKTFGEEDKSTFPYCAFTNLARLDGPLPVLDDFVDSALGENALNQEYRNFMEQHKLTKFKTLEETANLLKIPIPKDAAEKYRDLVEEWSGLGFQTLRDLLIHYAVQTND